ncbi:unnamed protein product, partial [Brenthis ino]
MASVELLSVSEVIKVLEVWDLKEFVDIVKEQQINGLKLRELSEGNVKLWRPSANTKKFISFIEDIREEPEKYLKCLINDEMITIKETNLCTDSQYQTVSVRKISQQENTNNFSTVEEILKKITAPKSFLYRNAQKKQERALTSYVPMVAGTSKKPKKFFRLSSYEYPIFDLKSRFSKTENCNDRGYYSVKTENKLYIQKTCKKPDCRPKYKSVNVSEELNEKVQEDHFYEDLCYNDMPGKEITLNQNRVNQVKPCIVKIQELFQSIKFPFFRKTEIVQKEQPVYKDVANDREGNLYENSSIDMYDSIHVAQDFEEIEKEKQKQKPDLAVEDYLEPVQVNKDYCDVCLKQKDDSLLGFIMNYFENRLGMRRETNEIAQSEESETEPSCERVWEHNMAARPLPVPVENEPYYMNIDRTEAESMLMGQPDGTFILRPSSQPNHTYTLSVSCSKAVHNVAVRRRPDGRLALGFARRGERSFTSIASLLRHHRKRRLLLVAGGEVIGATTLNDCAQYYQTPSNIPVLR